ncbi:FMN-binding negative transcriptional regulator [Actinomyces bowdenii]|uniref:FMN-binding negative transcriptional regulator n=1 Tax=Actinomyces bowdenii TaxID=131109 RepID=UPI00214C3892|nr:FMN-binding negative transcriptional regulator [Actinomyces bowdenii]MCR2052276.1 FMN-binding negative transcriptional regulator [Actinomyces bowdenii]
MYVPRHLELSEAYTTTLLKEVRAGNLVTFHAQGPAATLVPFYLDEERGVLVTRLARDNPQVTEYSIGPALVILDEADAYISPQWYVTNEVAPSVPTWDYITVHVRGAMRIDTSLEGAIRAVRELTLRTEPAAVLDAVDEPRLTAMARTIVAVEISLDHVEGKAQMSQDRHPDDVRSLISALEDRGETTLVKYLREVSLPYAEQRLATIARLHETRNGRAEEQAYRVARLH